jgi:hypothetical protein
VDFSSIRGPYVDYRTICITTVCKRGSPYAIFLAIDPRMQRGFANGDPHMHICIWGSDGPITTCKQLPYSYGWCLNYPHMHTGRYVCIWGMVILLYPYTYVDFVNLHLHTGIGHSPFAYGYTHIQMVIIDVPFPICILALPKSLYAYRDPRMHTGYREM